MLLLRHNIYQKQLPYLKIKKNPETGFSSNESDISNVTSLNNCVTKKGNGKVILKRIAF